MPAKKRGRGRPRKATSIASSSSDPSPSSSSSDSEADPRVPQTHMDISSSSSSSSATPSTCVTPLVLEIKRNSLKRSFDLVELPGVVRDREAALQRLGGIDAVRAYFASNPAKKRSKKASRVPLRMRFAPGGSAPVAMQGAISTLPNTFLLKLTHTATTPPSSSSSSSAPLYHTNVSVMGRVNHIVKFDSLADWQLGFPVSTQIRASITETNAVPYRYAKSNEPVPLLMGDAMDFEIPDAKPTRSRNEKWTSTLSSTSIYSSEAYQNHEYTKRLKVLFEKRPIASKHWLLENMGNDQQCIPFIRCVGYKLKTGAFRFMYVRYGLKPMESPEYAMYQQLQYNMDPKLVKQAAASQRGLHEADVHFRVMPKARAAYYQLVDIDIVEVQSILASAERLETPSHEFGWFSKATMLAFKNAVCTQVKKWIDEGPAVPALPALPAIPAVPLVPEVPEVPLVPVGSELQVFPTISRVGSAAKEDKKKKTAKKTSSKTSKTSKAGAELKKKRKSSSSAASLSSSSASSVTVRPSVARPKLPDADKGGKKGKTDRTTVIEAPSLLLPISNL